MVKINQQLEESGTFEGGTAIIKQSKPSLTKRRFFILGINNSHESEV